MGDNFNMKYLLLIALLSVSCGKKSDNNNGSDIVMVSHHQASNSYYLHMEGKSSVSYRRMSEADFNTLKNEFPSYILNDAHENFTEEDFRLEISNPGHSLYKCINKGNLPGTVHAGQTGAFTFKQLDCWQGEWY